MNKNTEIQTMEERFRKWRNDGEHETWSDKYGYIDPLDTEMVLEFIRSEIQADIEALKKEIEKKRKEIEIYTFDDKDLNGAQRFYHAYKSGVCDGKLVMTDDILTLLEETKI